MCGSFSIDLMLAWPFSLVQLQCVIRQHDDLKKEFVLLKDALYNIENQERSVVADVNDWEEEQLMEIEAYRDLSARWSNLEEDYAKLQSESEEREERSLQTCEDLATQVWSTITMHLSACSQFNTFLLPTNLAGGV